MGAPASRTPHQPTRAAAAEQPGAWSQSNQPQPHRAATSTLTKSHDMHTHMTDCCSHESLVWPGGAAGSPPGHTLPPAPHCRGSLLPPPSPGWAHSKAGTPPPGLVVPGNTTYTLLGGEKGAGRHTGTAHPSFVQI